MHPINLQKTVYKAYGHISEKTAIIRGNKYIS